MSVHWHLNQEERLYLIIPECNSGHVLSWADKSDDDVETLFVINLSPIRICSTHIPNILYTVQGPWTLK